LEFNLFQALTVMQGKNCCKTHQTSFDDNVATTLSSKFQWLIFQWLRYVNDFDISMTLIFQWLRYFNDFNISMTSIFQWLRYFNDFDISKTSIFQWLRYFNDFDVSMTSIFKWLSYFNEVDISMTSRFYWLEQLNIIPMFVFFFIIVHKFGRSMKLQTPNASRQFIKFESVFVRLFWQ